MTDPAASRFFSRWRSLRFGDREITEGVTAGADPELDRYLETWDGTHYVEEMPEGRRYVLVREDRARSERWWLHAVLLIVTLATTSLAGAILLGLTDGLSAWPTVKMLTAGFQFSAPLLASLLAHESGHYVTARRYRIDVSPPYFIPFAPQLNILGTLGAFIRVRSPVFDRRMLFDIGVAGPLAGIAVAIPLLAAGLRLSHRVAGLHPALAAHQFVSLGGGVRAFLGDSILLVTLRHLVAPGGVLELHPLALAGWVGLLVTMLNLLPLSQLDGGHIVFAMFGRAQRWVALAFWLALLPLGRLWAGWWLWAALSLVLGRGRLTHPRIIAPERELSPSRRRVGYLGLLLFAVTFAPVPIVVH